MSKRYFLIVSNMRSGSTLLETMLGALDGAFSDRELKWKPRVSGQQVHLPISRETADLQQLIDQELPSGDAVLVGSKLVVDPFSLTPEMKSHLEKIIPTDWYIIHLTRNYRDVFLSRQRGTEHLRSEGGTPVKGVRTSEVLLTAGEVSNENTVATKYVSREACFHELNDYLNADLWLSSMSKRHTRYFQLDYRDIFDRFRELIAFVGLNVASPDVDAILSVPPLQKLPPVSAARLVANLEQIEPVFDSMEQLRQILVVDQATLRNFLPNWQAYQARADERISHGDFTGAIADYSDALLGSPPNPALYFLRGKAHLEAGDCAWAIEDFDAGLVLDPGNKALSGLRASAVSMKGTVPGNAAVSATTVSILLVTQLWGESFVRLFLDVVLDSLATAGNLPALSGFKSVRYEIHTTRTDQTTIVCDPKFKKVRAMVGGYIEFAFIEVEGDLQNPYEVLAGCHRKSIRSAESRNAAIIFLMPDTIVGNGSLKTVLKCLTEGKRLVMSPGLRTVKEDMVCGYAAYASNSGPSIEKLVSVAVKNLHPISRALIWQKGGNINLYCSHLYWLVGKHSLYVRCAGMHPLMVYPKIWGRGFSHTHDWDYWYRAVPDEAEWFIPDSSDEICLIELSERSKYAGTETWVPATPYSIANFMAVTSREEPHWKLLSRYYVFRGEGFEEDVWVRTHQLAEEIIERAKSLLSVQEYQDRGTARSAREDFLGAISDYSCAIKGSAPNEALFFLRGTARLRVKDFVGAISDFDAGLRLAPSNGPLLELKRLAHREHGQTCADRRKFAEAIVEYSLAIDAASPDAALFFLRGNAKLKLADYKGAVADFAAGLRLDPENGPLQELLRAAKKLVNKINKPF